MKPQINPYITPKLSPWLCFAVLMAPGAYVLPSTALDSQPETPNPQVLLAEAADFSQDWMVDQPNAEQNSPGDATSETMTSSPQSPIGLRDDRQHYRQAIETTKAMVHDSQAMALAAARDLSILNVTWEDTGRYKNSAVGPNISDMTIQIQEFNPDTNDYQLHLMPVIRYPNFEDRSADVPLDAFSLLVGNEKGEDLEKVGLREVLDNLRDYLHEPDSWEGREQSLLADRDSHVLVSAQACFLPIPQGDEARFNPVLFNYQSYQDHPAVLTILATREGTSVTIIDNVRDGFEAGATWGQRLFFNQDGERASLTAQRATEFLREQNPNDPAITEADPETLEQMAESQGLNLVMLIQVPLKQAQPSWWGEGFGAALEEDGMMLPSAPMATQAEVRAESDVEAAVIGHGPVEGPFTEIDGLKIERDPDFPIRVTVQFYKGTSNGVVSAADMEHIEEQIARVYDDADYVGSLVVEGETGRPTEYEGDKEEPANWWPEFWRRHQENTGQTRTSVWEMLRRLFS
jgi:hypothetical protein